MNLVVLICLPFMFFCFLLLNCHDVVAHHVENCNRPNWLNATSNWNQHGNMAISVVILNWRRPENVKTLINEMETYPEVSEIIVLMCLESTKFNVNSNKTVSLDFTLLESQWGLLSRFRGCQIALNEWVLILDDDLIVTRPGLSRLISEKRKTPNRLIALWGRDYDENKPYYIAKEVAPNSTAKIALTRALLLDYRFCHAFFQLHYIMEDLAKKSHVYWNGEDIWMSLVSRVMTSEMPYIVEAKNDYYRLLDHDRYQHIGISLGKQHYTYRNRFLVTAIQRLSCFAQPQRD